MVILAWLLHEVQYRVLCGRACENDGHSESGYGDCLLIMTVRLTIQTCSPNGDSAKTCAPFGGYPKTCSPFGGNTQTDSNTMITCPALAVQVHLC